MSYRCDRQQAAQAIRRSQVVIVMNRKHVKTPQHMVDTMWEVYQAGFVAECTFRIDLGLIKEGMAELTKRRESCPADKPFILGVGSVINPSELDAALEMGFDMIVAPANVMGGFGEGAAFVKTCHRAGVFCAPAVFTPTELNYFLERPDEYIPDALKVFPANSHGPEGVKGLLAPFVRERHKNRIIMPTGGVDYQTGPEYQKAIAANGFTPILGMSAPLALVEKRDKAGDVAVIRESLAEFRTKFQSAV